MGTRGIILIKIKGKIIYIYNQFDSYYEGLGCLLIRELLDLLEKYSIEQIRDMFAKLTLVSEEEADRIYEEHVDFFSRQNGLTSGSEIQRGINMSVWDKYKSDHLKDPLAQLLHNGYAVDFETMKEDEELVQDYNYEIDLDALKLGGCCYLDINKLFNWNDGGVNIEKNALIALSELWSRY